MGKKLKDEEVVGAGFLDRVADLVGIMAPFVSASIYEYHCVAFQNLASSRVSYGDGNAQSDPITTWIRDIAYAPLPRTLV